MYNDISAQAGLEQKTMRTITLRLLPFLILCYFFNLLDRSNIGIAALQMRPDLGLSSTAYGLGGSLFYISYFLFEVPSNLAMQRFGARFWMARIMVTWGLVSAMMALTQGPLSFYLLRFLLGATEAGFFPGLVLFATYWFPRRYQGRIFAAFAVAVPLSHFIGSPVSSGLLLLDGQFGLRGWQWVFVAEGVPSALLGLVCLVLLRDSPDKAGWLPADQRSWLADRLASEAKDTSNVGHMSLMQLARNRTVWALAIACGASSSATSTLAVWQPQLLKGFGLTNFQTGMVNAIPYGVSVLAMVFWSAHSDRTGERRWHTALPLIVIAAAFAGIYAFGFSLAFTVVMLSCILVGYTSFKGPFWAFTSETLSPTTAAAGIAGINAVSTLLGGGVVSLVGVIQQATGSFGPAMLPLVFLGLLGASFVLLVSGQRPQPGAAAAGGAPATNSVT